MSHYIDPTSSDFAPSPRAICGQSGPLTEDPRQVDCEACRGRMAAHLAVTLGLEVEADYDQREVCPHGEDDECTCPPEPTKFYAWEEGFSTHRRGHYDLSFEVAREVGMAVGGQGTEITPSRLRSAKKDFASEGEAALHYLRVLRDRINVVLGDKA